MISETRKNRIVAVATGRAKQNKVNARQTVNWALALHELRKMHPSKSVKKAIEFMSIKVDGRYV